MVLPKIEERTLYPPIINYLEESGFQAIGNTIIQGKEPDIIFKYGSYTFVIEVKVGKKNAIGLSAVAQAYDYGRRLKTQNVVILIYPDNNYIVGFIHGIIEQYCMCLIANYLWRKPGFNERIGVLSLLRRGIIEIDDVITRAEGLKTTEEYGDELDD